MNPGIILQARLTSSRFPNKVLCPLLGKPVIAWCIEEIVKTKLPWVLAMPNTKTDLGLNQWCKEYSDRTGIKIRTCFGSRDHVAHRFKEALDVVKFDPIIRICADSPMVSHKDVELALKLYEERKCYNIVNHVQVFGMDEFLHEYYGTIPENDEHAGTRGMIMTVDYPEDIDHIEQMFKNNFEPFKNRIKLKDG